MRLDHDKYGLFGRVTAKTFPKEKSLNQTTQT